jgi:hypothetical protein
MIALNREAGMAKDIGDIWRSKIGKDSEQEDPIETRVEIALCDENEICFSWKEGRTNTALYLPIERLQALLLPDTKKKK